MLTLLACRIFIGWLVNRFLYFMDSILSSWILDDSGMNTIRVDRNDQIVA